LHSSTAWLPARAASFVSGSRAPRTAPILARRLLPVLLLLCATGPAGAAAAPAATDPAAGLPAPIRVALDLPLFDPAVGQTQTPGYHARRFEIRLAPQAAPSDPSLVRAQGRTGVFGVDRLLARFGAVAIEPEFPGAEPPAPGSGAEDLRAYYIVQLPAGVALPEALGAFRAEASVRGADPIGVFPVQFVPNDSLFPLQYAFSQTSDRDSDLPEAWDLTPGDTSVVVAIIDTGVLWTHPDLGGPAPHTGGNIWRNWAEMAGAPGVDDDANGYVDDFVGWDFVTGVYGRAGEDVNVADNDPADFVGHGTACAGVAGAVTDNGSGVAGAGNRVKLMALRAGWDDGVGAGGVVDMSFCAQAIYYAARMGATAINCSWSNGNLSGLGAAVSYAVGRGATVVVASGNQGTANPPANYLGSRGDCADVGALDANDVLAGFSNYGPWVEVCAGGVSIRTTYSTRYTPSYSWETGTSFAAPLVTGIVGLYQSWRKAQGLPAATPGEVLLRLRDTADRVDDVNPGFEGLMGGGRVNAARMILDPPTSFAVVVNGAVTTAPAFVDWGGAAGAIVFGTESAQMWALDGATGKPLPGWPFYLDAGVRSNPAVWDVDFDGLAEVIVGVDDGKVYALRADGSDAAGWPAAVGGLIDSGPAVGDVAGTPAYEIVVATSAPHAVHVLDRQGQPLPGWPKSLPAAVHSSPALADLDGDGKAEIVFGADDSTVYVLRGDGTAVPQWPLKVGGAVAGSPAVGDLDADGVRDVVVGADDGLVYAWSAAGTPLAGWPVSAGGAAVRGGPALADVDSDSRLEVVAGTDAGALWVWDEDGSAHAGWPVGLGGEVRGSPTVADVDGNGTVEVIAGSFDRKLHVRRADGLPQAGWPRLTSGAITGGGSLGDPDGDGRLEIAFGSADGMLYCWDLGPGTYDAGHLPWYTAGRSFLRQGTVTTPSIGVTPTAPAGGPRLSVSPNPSRGRSYVSFALPGKPGAAVDFLLYDAAGRRLRSERGVLDGIGVARWTVEARGAGAALGAGLYFLEARSAGVTARAKWVLVR